jgi:hypothetical protein
MVMSVGDRFGDAEAVVDGSLRLTFVELADRSAEQQVLSPVWG